MNRLDAESPTRAFLWTLCPSSRWSLFGPVLVDGRRGLRGETALFLDCLLIRVIVFSSKDTDYKERITIWQVLIETQYFGYKSLVVSELLWVGPLAYRHRISPWKDFFYLELLSLPIRK